MKYALSLLDNYHVGGGGCICTSHIPSKMENGHVINGIVCFLYISLTNILLFFIKGGGMPQ